VQINGAGWYPFMVCPVKSDGRRIEGKCFIRGIFERGIAMKTTQRLALSAVAAALLLGLGGCGEMSTRDKDTAIGAGIGAVGGAVLTGGSAVGTVGGAAVGGVIGNQVGKDKR
jgi:osmotically inducible lipoprotein OsmB